MSDAEVKGVDFATIPTRNYEEAAKFYGETLGLEFAKKWGDMPAGEFETGNLTLALMQMDAFGQEFTANGGAIALHVDDVAAARAELESKGVEFDIDDIDSGVCHMSFFHDPDGNPLMLHHRYAPKPAPGEIAH
jgi:catechol 2,3-dioxygenase-like lactoylglutathione lyase family enzyme